MQERIASAYRRAVLTAAVVAAVAVAVPARAQEECESLNYIVKAVSLGGTYFATNSVFNYPADGVGHFDTLMTTTVTVGGARPSCLVADFSTEAYPLDNSIIFQVRVDGVPMSGHMNGTGDIATPLVWDPEETDLNNPRMVAHTFFKKVRPGVHTVDVLFAGCCSAAPPAGPAAYAGSPVLILHHQ